MNTPYNTNAIRPLKSSQPLYRGQNGCAKRVVYLKAPMYMYYQLMHRP